MNIGNFHRLSGNELAIASCIFLGILLGFSPSKAFALTAGDGKNIVLSGEYQTSGGEATYSLPIAVAPGRAGHQPNLSFEYRSNSGNGPLGVGWHLKGLSSIYRCGKNRAIDGVWGGGHFNAEDQFCIDGKRLIAISGKAGGAQTEYRTHIDDYRKVMSFGQQGNGPQYFKVWTKTGQVFEYGVTGDARVELPGKSDVYKWSLNKITDKTKQNAIHYAYSENQAAGTHLLSKVSYVGGSVVLNYDTRTDQTFSYLKGSKLNQQHRIKSIVSRNGSGREFATYHLTYQSSAGTQRSLLKEIKQCVGGACSTPVAFEWQSKKSVSLSSSKSGFGFNTKKVKYYDIERDGIFELFSLSEDFKNVVVNKSSVKIDGHKFTNKYGPVCQDFAFNDWDGNDKPYYLALCAWNSGEWLFSALGASLGDFISYPSGNGKYSKFFSGYVSDYKSWSNTNNLSPRDTNGDGIYKLETGCSDCVYYDFDHDGKNNEAIFTNKNDIVVVIDNKVVKVSSSRYSLESVNDFNGDGYLDVLLSRQIANELTKKVGNASYELTIKYFDGVDFENDTQIVNIKVKGELVDFKYDCSVSSIHPQTCRGTTVEFTPYEIKLLDVNSDGYLDFHYDDKVYVNRGGVFNVDDSFVTKLS